MKKQDQWDTYAALYHQGIGETGDELHKKLIDPVIFEFLGKIKNAAVLDAGCGNGYLLKKLALHTKILFGLDASKKLLTFARSLTHPFKHVTLLHVNLLKPFPLEDNKFDVVIANMVLQYLPELHNFAKECARVLKKKGMLIVTVDHPGHALFLRAQELAGKKNEKFITSGSYFKTEKRIKKSLWDKAILEYYHRPMYEYISPFSDQFRLEKFAEKSLDTETPRILALKWIKI